MKQLTETQKKQVLQTRMLDDRIETVEVTYVDAYAFKDKQNRLDCEE